MKAIVKNISENTEVEDNDESNMFTYGMKEFIGKEIDVQSYIDAGWVEGNYDNWFRGITVGYGWHSSWLEFIPEKHIMSDADKFLKGLMEEFDSGNLEEVDSSHWFPLYLNKIREYLSKFEN